MAINGPQQEIISQMQLAIEKVNQKQAENAVKLEAELIKVQTEGAERIEAMRATGEKFEKLMETQLSKMIEEGNEFKHTNQQLFEDMKLHQFNQGVLL